MLIGHAIGWVAPQVICFVVRFFMYWVLFMFLLVAVHDYTRTAFAARMLYNLITPQTKDTYVLCVCWKGGGRGRVSRSAQRAGGGV